MITLSKADKSAALAGTVLELAADALAEWMPGYTFPGTGPQQRIRVVEELADGIVVSLADCGPFPGDGRHVRIRLTAEEVPA